MSIEIRTAHGKLHEVYVGDLTLLFSYETLVGFAAPGVGRVTCENIWGPTVGRHINSFPAKYARIPLAAFEACRDALDVFFQGKIDADVLRVRLQEILNTTIL